MCTMCSYNPVCAVDGSHKAVIEAETLTANPTFTDVTFSTIPGDTSTGETISVGQTIQETLETAGDRDWFKIELQAGDRITFELDGVDHNGSSLGALEDPFVRLYSSTGSYVTGDDDGGPGRNSNLAFTIQSSGTYFIEAAAWDDRYTGDYELSVSTAAPLAPGTLTELSEYLVSGYWSTPRYWNLGSTGLNAQNGVLTYTLDGFSEDTDGLTAARANLVREAFKMYEAILGIDFQETSSTTADFRFKDNDTGAYAGSSYGFSNGEGFISSSRINVATSWSGGSSAYDSYTFQTILHEIGHALGLGHQGGYNGSASYPSSANFENDSWQGSMMSYFSQSENNSISATNAILISPMTVDWLALDDHYAQYGYGVSNAFTGNTIWGFNTNIAASTSQVFHDLALYADDRAFTVIDSGGIDTLDFSGYSQNQRIDLTVSQANADKATTSDIGSEKENLSLAVGTVIENAKSGSGSDQLIGNEVDNSLYGGGGNDTLEGKGGDDLLDGGVGSSDVALFSAASSQYQITQTGTNQFSITQISGSQDGTDTLVDVETARFSNTDIDLTTWTPPSNPLPTLGVSDGQMGLQGDYSGTLTAQDTQGVDMVVLLPGDDTRFGASGTESYTYDLTLIDASIGAGGQITFQANTLRTDEDFTLDASAEIDGSVFVFGGEGAEDLTGSQQDDSFFFGTDRFGSGDRVNGQGGTLDSVGLQGDYSAQLVMGVDQLVDIEVLALLSSTDARFGAGSGAPYNYNLVMNDGNVASGDSLVVNANTLAANESLTFDGSAESDGSFRIFSGNGEDQVIGSQGSDLISGLGGADTLTGGSGVDTFIYSTASESELGTEDLITDFENSDLIQLSGVDANELVGGTQSFNYIGSAGFSNTAGELRTAANAPGNWTIEADTNGDGVADLAINVATASNGVSFSESNFIL